MLKMLNVLYHEKSLSLKISFDCLMLQNNSSITALILMILHTFRLTIYYEIL